VLTRSVQKNEQKNGQTNAADGQQEQVEEENQGKTGEPRITWKTKMMVVSLRNERTWDQTILQHVSPWTFRPARLVEMWRIPVQRSEKRQSPRSFLDTVYSNIHIHIHLLVSQTIHGQRERIDWVKVLHPTWHKIGHFGDVLPSQSLGLVMKY